MVDFQTLIKKWEAEYQAEKAKEVETLFEAFLEVIRQQKPLTTTILMALKMLEHATVEEKLNEFTSKKETKQSPKPSSIEFKES